MIWLQCFSKSLFNAVSILTKEDFTENKEVIYMKRRWLFKVEMKIFSSLLTLRKFGKNRKYLKIFCYSFLHLWRPYSQFYICWVYFLFNIITKWLNLVAHNKKIYLILLFAEALKNKHADNKFRFSSKFFLSWNCFFHS